jgi:photosystem II stability/assembly factor-like uncharacterized protein
MPKTTLTAELNPLRAAALALILAASSSDCVIPLSPPADNTGPAQPSADSGTSDPGADSSVVGNWINVTSNLANMASQCGNMSFLSAKPDEDLLIAGIALDGLWASRNGGENWSQLGLGSDASAPITNRTSSIVYDPQVSTRYWESGLYNAGGVFHTTDDGVTLVQDGDVHHSDLVSVDFSDPNRQTLLAGGHEQSQTLYRSTNGGMTWTNVGGALPANTACTFPLVIDAMTHLVGCDGYGGGPIGVYRTTDGGNHWSSTTTFGGIDQPLVASDGSIYWSSPNAAGIARSTDHGQTWSNVVVGAGVVGSVHPVELPDGRIATIGPPYGTQRIILSSDHGATWTPASAPLPFSASGVTYSSQRKAFYIWHFSCGTSGTGDDPTPVPSDAIMRFDFDYKTE